MPGVKDVEKIDDTTYGVRVEQKVSFLKASFQLQINIEEVRAPEYIRTVGEGKDSKIAASLKQKNEVTLEAVSENETKVRINSSVDVFGKLALARLHRHQEPGEQDLLRVRKERESEGGVIFPRAAPSGES